MNGGAEAGVPARDARVLEAFEASVLGLIRAAEGRPWLRAIVEPDVVIASTGIPAPPFNVISATRFSDETADRRIDQTLAVARDLGLPFSWWIGPLTTPADLPRRLRRRDLHLIDSPAMALDLAGWRTPETVPPVEVERVRDQAAFHDACDVVALGFDMPRDIIDAFETRFGELGFGDEAAIRTYLLRWQGRPVATALGQRDGDVVGIYNVATVPDARGRGFGSAVTAAALADRAREGCTLAILESSDMGLHVYERLGFRRVGVVTVAIGRPR